MPVSLQRLYRHFSKVVGKPRLPNRPNETLTAIASISLIATGLILGLTQLGKVEPLERLTYDRLVQLRGDRPPDPRLFIIGINERDIEQQQVTPPDQVLADVLGILQEHNPRVIGLDLHRNAPQPPGWEALAQRMQADNVIVIKKLGDPLDEGISAPPGIPDEQIGFNDLPIDADGVVRRSLLIGSTEEGVFYSFALRLAMQYLVAEGIQPRGSEVNPDYLQLGEATFFPLSEGNGGYHQADAGGYQILLDYRTSSQVAIQVSLTDVLEQRFDPALIEDRIVLIGTTATSLKDVFFTPYSTGQAQGQKMSGVEIHAQMVSQLLDAAVGDRPLFWFWPQWAEVVWVWAWAVVAASLAGWLQRPLVLGLAALGLLGSLAGMGFALFMQQGWIPMAAPALAAGLSLGCMVTYRAQQAQKQQHMVMTLLGQSTSPEIANALWESRDRLLKSGKLPGKRLMATMLFSDIKGFSTRAEKLAPEALMDWLNDYLNAMVDAVKVHRGIVNKFTGDGLLAVFGVPVPRATDAEIAQDARQAVDCALAMGDRLNQLNQIWESQGLAIAQMRIGIYTGPVVVGSLGGRERLEYGVIGDSVNTAARLESCLKTHHPGICRILIARETLEYLADDFWVEPWGEVELKGKEQLAEVYRVLGRKQPPSALDPPDN